MEDPIFDFLYEPGIPMIGREISDEDAKSLAQSKSSFTPYCLVRDWVWIDLIMPGDVLKELEKINKKPVMLYSHTVIYDSSRRFDVGDWVRTTPLIEFTDGCLFRTQNSIYVLIGNGVRKEARLSTMVKIF